MRIVGLLVLLPAVAFGAGFYMSENGTKTLLEGGAFVGQADDVSAMQHNPAGLAQTRGFSFLLDGELLNHSITFQREDPGFDPANPPMTSVQPVSNIGGPFVLPMAGVSYGFPLLDRTLSVALGVYGPPSDGHYAFPAPNYTKNGTSYVQDPRKYAPERYTLIQNTITILYPTLSVAYAVHPKVLLGVSIQPVLGQFAFSQSVSSAPFTPMRQRDEDPSFDSVVNVNLPFQYVGFTGIAGILVKPIDMLSIGASFRPQVVMKAQGSLGIDLGEAAKALNTTVTGDKAGLQLALPPELKVGVHVQPLKKLGINCDFVYQGWQSVQQITLSPQNVTMQIGTQAPKPISEFDIVKNWGPSFQLHLGAGYQLFPWLSLHAGAWYETAAIPDTTIGVDFLHFAEVMITGGIGLHFFGLDFYLGAAGSPTTTHAITTSNARAGSTDPSIMGSVVGNGIYTSGTFVATAGLRGHFGGAPPLPSPEPTQLTPPPPPEEQPPPPQTAPAPVPTP